MKSLNFESNFLPNSQAVDITSPAPNFSSHAARSMGQLFQLTDFSKGESRVRGILTHSYGG